MNHADLTKTIALYDQLAAAAKAKATEARAQLQAAAREQYEQQGMAPTWRLPDVGTVTLPVSQESIYLANPAALLAWVMDHAPEAIETLPSVAPTFLRELEKRLVSSGDLVVDSGTGEAVPGYAVRAGGTPGSVSIRLSADAKSFARQHADGLLERFAVTLTGDDAATPGGEA